MTESGIQKVSRHPIYPRDSEMYSDKRFVNFDNGSVAGSLWTCFYISKITHQPILTRLVDTLMNLYLTNYLNQ